MAEIVRTAAEVAAFEGTTRTGALTLLTENDDPYLTGDGRFNNRVADLLALLAGLEVYKDGDLTYGVRAGKFRGVGATVTYAGSTGNALTDDATNYIYLTSAGTLTKNTTGFPATNAVQLATILTAGGVYAISAVTDCRQAYLWSSNGTVLLKSFNIPFQYLRNDDFTAMDATGGAGLFSYSDGGFGTGTMIVVGEAASGNSKTDTLQFEFILPPNYVASGGVTIAVNARETVGAATVATTISGEVYESGGDGTVGADLAASWDDDDVTAVAWGVHTLTVTDATLVAGDKLRVYLRIVTNDDTGGVGTIAAIGEIVVKCDVYTEF